MKHKYVFVLAFCCMLFSGCSGQEMAREQPVKSAKEATDAPSGEGVSYRKIPKSVIQDSAPSEGVSDDSHEYLSLKNKIYTHTAVADQQDPEKLLGKKITNLYGRDYVIWSDRKDDLPSSNCSAELYCVKGFDPSYLVAVRRATPADHAVSVVDLYEHVNDFTVAVGSDLYQKWLKLDQAVCVKGKLCNLDGSVQGASKVLEEKAYSAWLQELMQARFLPVTETMEEDCKEGAKRYIRLSFAHESGVVQELFVYDNGMVCYGVGEYSFYQKMKVESAQELICNF